MSSITGGTPAGRNLIVLTDEQMREIKALEAAGPTPGYQAVVAANRRADRRLGRKSHAEMYEEYVSAVKAAIYDNDPRIQFEWQRANAEFLRLKDIQPGVVHQNQTLSNMSIMYANEEYQGLNLLPMVPVGKESDTYYIYGQGDRIQYPNAELPVRGRANEINETRTTATYTLLPFGFSQTVSNRTLQNQDAPLDEMVDLVEACNEGLAFITEQQIATLVTTAGSYAGNTAAVAAANRWDTPTGGDPISDIQTGIESLWSGRGPGMRVCGSPLEVYHELSRHPAILDLFKYNGSSPGLATPDMIANFFMLERYHVCAARQDTTNEVGAVTATRMWGSDSFFILRVARRPTIRNASFGYTLRHRGEKLTQVQYAPLEGHGGSWTAQVSMLQEARVVAAPTGYLLTTVRG